MRLSEFARRSGGRLVGEDAEILGFATDSRAVKAGDLFLCIQGANVDGHDFAGTAYGAGAVACLAEREIGGAAVLVDRIEEGLARFGRSVRDEFSGPVVGVTGSNGKSSTKEMVAGALSGLGEVVKNEGNHNTEYTSPLLWSRVGAETRAVVVEMGMRGFGQIEHLASIARPTVGVVTNVGSAHIEKVGSREGIATAKAELLEALPGDGVAVLWAEDKYLDSLRGRFSGETLLFGHSPEAWSRVLGYRADGWTGSWVYGAVGGEEYEAHLPVLGKHQALNVAAAMAVAVRLGVPVLEAVRGIEEVPPLGMRMEVREVRGVTVLVDTYNASPDSTVAAIKTLETGPVAGRRWAVLGEMKELGDYTEGGHRAVGKVLGVSSVDRVLLVGGPTGFIREEALAAGFPSSRMEWCEEVDLEKVTAFLREAGEGDAVLIKGSRALGLERALEGLV